MILCTCRKARVTAGFFFVVLLKECNTGALPLHPARGIIPLDPLLLYNIAPKVTAPPITFGALL